MRSLQSHPSIMRPIYFGPKDRPRFAQLHLPAQGSPTMGIVICAPLGYEGQFAQLGLLHLAATAATQQNAAVLSIDYDGCGDSAGTDEDPERVAAWLASISEAVDEIKNVIANDAPIVLAGLRAGALLAGAVAATREDIAGVVLWAPCASGRTFLREQRAFASMAHITATPNAPKQSDWGEKGFEANGYVFTHETATALEKLDFKTFARAPAKNILVVQRAELPAVKIPTAWRSEGIAYAENATRDYEAMMQPPWMSAQPSESVQTIVEWLKNISHTPAVTSTRTAVTVDAETAQVTQHARETAVWYDNNRERLAILTEPSETTATLAVILVTSTFGYRIGPNRMNVAAAREFAEAGIATLRIDLRYTNAGETYAGIVPNAPYNLAAIDDVSLAVNFLKARGFKKIALAGICAGAFLAWYSSLVIKGIDSTILINPRTFVPIRYDLDDHNRFLQAPISWRMKMRRERNPFRLLRALRPNGLRALEIFSQILTARLPIAVTSTLGGRLYRLGRAGTRTNFIYSSDDEGVKDFSRLLGRNLQRLTSIGYLKTTYIEGPDHSFTQRWANTALIAEMTKLFTEKR